MMTSRKLFDGIELYKEILRNTINIIGKGNMTESITLQMIKAASYGLWKSIEEGEEGDIEEISEDFEHICYTCLFASKDITSTTIDRNGCERYCKITESPDAKVIYSDGNTAIYDGGAIQIDNGGGYWIVKCPYYKRYRRKIKK